MAFYSDLQQAKINERFIGQTVCDYNGGSGLAFSQGRNSDYDFSYLLKGTEFLYELKTDYLAAKTRNVYIETGNGSRDTGLAVTKSNKVIYYVPQLGLAVSFPASKVLDYIGQTPGLRRVSNCGDGNSAGILLPLANLTGAPLFAKTLQIQATPESV
jgi:hypothetical protein